MISFASAAGWTAPAIVVLSVVSAAAQPGEPRAPAAPERIEVSPSRVFAEIKAGLLERPSAERATVTVRHEGRSPASAALTIRTAPGTHADGRDATVLVEAGDLRAWTNGAVLVCVLAGNESTYFQAEMDQPASVRGLGRHLPPLPLPHFGLLWNREPEPIASPVPGVGPVLWKPVTVPVAAAESDEPITLTGTVASSTVSVVLTSVYVADKLPDGRLARRLRLRSLTAPLPGESDPAAPPGTAPAVRSISVTFVPIEPGDPSAWKPGLSGRVRVATLAELASRPPAAPAVPAPPPTQPPAQGEPPPPPGGAPAGQPPTGTEKGQTPRGSP